MMRMLMRVREGVDEESEREREQNTEYRIQRKE